MVWKYASPRRPCPRLHASKEPNTLQHIRIAHCKTESNTRIAQSVLYTLGHMEYRVHCTQNICIYRSKMLSTSKCQHWEQRLLNNNSNVTLINVVCTKELNALVALAQHGGPCPTLESVTGKVHIINKLSADLKIGASTRHNFHTSLNRMPNI